MFDLWCFEFKINSVMEKIMNYLTGVFRYVLANVVRFVTYLHARILGLNDSYEFYLSDKELHFYVVAVTGVLLIVVLYPLFRYLVKHNKTLYIVWIYVFTFLLVFTLLIEIGQSLTGTGMMDYMDTVAGIVGFLLASFIVFVIRWIYMFIKWIIGKVKDSSNDQGCSVGYRWYFTEF